MTGAYCVHHREKFWAGDAGREAYRLFLTLSDPDGHRLYAGGPASGFVAPAARDHGTTQKAPSPGGEEVDYTADLHFSEAAAGARGARRRAIPILPVYSAYTPVGRRRGDARNGTFYRVRVSMSWLPGRSVAVTVILSPASVALAAVVR